MSSSKYYRTGEPGGPVVLRHYNTLWPGMLVEYVNPSAPPLPGPLRITELIGWPADRTFHVGAHAIAILNDGEYEVNADNLQPSPLETFAWSHFLRGHGYYVTASAVCCECGESATR